MREGEAKPQPPRLCQSVGEVGRQREIVLQLVDVDGHDVPLLRRDLGAGQRQRPSHAHDQGTEQPGALPADDAFVQRHQHDPAFVEQVGKGELGTRLSQHTAQVLPEQELADLIQHRLDDQAALRVLEGVELFPEGAQRHPVFELAGDPAAKSVVGE